MRGSYGSWFNLVANREIILRCRWFPNEFVISRSRGHHHKRLDPGDCGNLQSPANQAGAAHIPGMDRAHSLGCLGELNRYPGFTAVVKASDQTLLSGNHLFG